MSKKQTDFTLEELEVLNKIAHKSASALDFRIILKQVLEILAHDMGMNRGMISIYRRDLNEIIVDVSHGFDASDNEVTYRLGEGITGKVIETGRPVAIPNIEKAPMFLDRTQSRKKVNRSELAFICVPIKFDKEVIGALSVDRIFDSDATLAKEMRFLEEVCHFLSHRVRARRLLDENLGLKKMLHLSSGNLLLGNCESLRHVNYLASQVAESKTSVLITGETGTGKGIVASLIHKDSDRAGKKFVTVNCGAIPENLIESELFGHEKGAFTGADKMKPGKFELAHRGTLFLDEIGEMPLTAQIKLLRVIQEREMERVGGIKTLKVDVRIIAATNKNLEEEVKLGQFREDLFYRLNVFPIHMPPLRDRGADILLLADSFILRYSKNMKKNVKRIDTPSIDLLMSYHWPGNVRELENCIERAILLTTSGVLEVQHLPPSLQMMSTGATESRGKLDAMVSAYEKSVILQALKDSHGNQAKAGQALSCSGRVMHYKINKYKIDIKRFLEKREKHL
ncbi:MAG: sigma-54-dependent Fis family transcriptional regulator [Planctomycetota bacterium]|nr:MAG: sigma-54-dependent Fis family transcriptional regulator [Planctomycetota bacterium]